MNTCIPLVSCMLASLELAGIGAARDEPRLALPRTVLLVDDADVLYRSGTRRVLHTFIRHPANPLIRCERPWEGLIAWTSVYRNPETGLYQLWYQAYSGHDATPRTHACVVCYAESADGIHFAKPDLELFTYRDIPRTNIVLVGSGGHSVRYANSVVVDPRDPDPARRYKMAYFDFEKSPQGEFPGLCVAFSPDGIRWTKHHELPRLKAAYCNPGEPVPFADETGRPWSVPLSVADAVDVFYDPRRNVFASYGKIWIDGPDGGMAFKHAMGRTESRDFIHWSPPQVVCTPDDLDPPWVEFHTSPVFYYNDRYFCLNQVLNRAARGGVIDIELMVSRDGLQWERPFRGNYVLARRPGNEFDGGSIFTNSTPVVLDEEIRFYYGAYSQGATGETGERIISGIGLASLPRDRFAGLRSLERTEGGTLTKPAEHVGQVTLKPIDLRGVRHITVNADASEGAVRVELLDEKGYRIRGFTRDDATPLRGDNLRHPVAWARRTLGHLPPGRYMLRIHIERATVYAVTLWPGVPGPASRPASPGAPS